MASLSRKIALQLQPRSSSTTATSSKLRLRLPLPLPQRISSRLTSRSITSTAVAYAKKKKTHDNRTINPYAQQPVGEIRSRFETLGAGKVSFSFHPTNKHIGIITLDNPNTKNSLSCSMMAQFANIIDNLEENVSIEPTKIKDHNPYDDLVAIVIRGSHNTFCAGFDLSLTSAESGLLTPGFGAQMSALMQDTLTRLQNLPLISIAAIEGYAIGGGAELTTCTDYRAMDKNALIRFVQIHMGVTPGWGGGCRLLDVLEGLGKRQEALKILCSAQKIDSETAKKLGYASIISEKEDIMDDVESFVNELCLNDNQPPRIVRAMKSLVVAHRNGGDPNRTARILKLERNVFTQCWGAYENKKAIQKSLEKRLSKKAEEKKE